MKLTDRIINLDERARDLERDMRSLLRDAQESAESAEHDGDRQVVAEDMVDLLETLKAHKANLREVDNEANPSLVTVMDSLGVKKFTRGSLEIERRVSNYRSNWQNQVLVRAVITTALDELQDRNYVDQESGELVNERSIVAPWMEAAVDRLLECAAFRDWRVTALRARVPGLDPDNFCDTKRSTKAVISVKKG